MKKKPTLAQIIPPARRAVIIIGGKRFRATVKQPGNELYISGRSLKQFLYSLPPEQKDLEVEVKYYY